MHIVMLWTTFIYPRTESLSLAIINVRINSWIPLQAGNMLTS